MPLKKGKSKAVVSQNISEFHTGKTYAHTAAKYGKKRANAQAVAVALSQARRSRADGGSTPWFVRQEARNISRGQSGLLGGHTPGRTDVLPIKVGDGGFVIPSDIVSALGQGNTAAGGAVLSKMFNSGPMGMKPAKASGRMASRMGAMRPPKGGKIHFADGGSPEGEGDGAVPIIAASGEYVLSPDQVAQIGGGDMDKSHKILDKFVDHVRKQHIATLQKLPGTVKS